MLIVLVVLAFMSIAPGVAAEAPAAGKNSDLLDLADGAHPLSQHFSYEVKKGLVTFLHEGEPLGVVGYDGLIIYNGAQRAGFAVSDDGGTLLYVHWLSPYTRSVPKELAGKAAGLYEYVHGRGDRLVYADAKPIGSPVPLPRNSLRFTQKSRRGDWIRTTEGEETIEDEIGWTPLHRAAFLGDVLAIQRLLKEGAATGAHAGDGYTPLQIAISNDQNAAAIALIEGGADVNAGTRDSPGRTPLHMAAWLGNIDLVATLLAKGGDVNSGDGDGKTPLFDALRTGKYDVATYLITHGARLTVKDSLGWTPLHHFATHNLDEPDFTNEERALIKAQDAAGSPREALLRLMISKGADVNARTNDGDTPLDIAQRNKRVVTTQVLLENGAVSGHGKKK